MRLLNLMSARGAKADMKTYFKFLGKIAIYLLATYAVFSIISNQIMQYKCDSYTTTWDKATGKISSFCKYYDDPVEPW